MPTRNHLDPTLTSSQNIPGCEVCGRPDISVHDILDDGSNHFFCDVDTPPMDDVSADAQDTVDASVVEPDGYPQPTNPT
jgi:hypothetical protein